ncbi:endonuclease/exonuclease/phosphatase family protein [Corynebacterium nuruki]|uniref:endonuclease/exonuclease/phosphatase family protein n=1 Tax=Corynebacterium nuruki TaxID=1032851 RepID=UPI0002486A85|nr:endonuclease/exonuclease/phosphatase family protein [Corynebacterium nuruki]
MTRPTRPTFPTRSGRVLRWGAVVLSAFCLVWATAPLWGRFTAALPDALAWSVPVAQASWPVGATLTVVAVTGAGVRAGRTVPVVVLGAGVLVTAGLAPAALDHAGRSAGLPDSTRDRAPGTFRVLSVNTWYHQADRTALADIARDLRPDAVMLLETSTAEAAAVAEVTGLRSVLPVSTRSRGGGTALLLPPDEISGAPFPAYDAHLTRHQMPVAGVRSGATLTAVHTNAPFNRELVAGWTREFDDLRDRVAGRAATTPLLIAGDLNASGAHPEFRRLTDGLSDCTGATSGMLAAPTWPAAGVASWPVARLDHILVRGGDCLAGGTVDVPGSDHRGVWADVRWARGAGH